MLFLRIVFPFEICYKSVPGVYWYSCYELHSGDQKAYNFKLLAHLKPFSFLVCALYLKGPVSLLVEMELLFFKKWSNAHKNKTHIVLYSTPIDQVCSWLHVFLVTWEV